VTQERVSSDVSPYGGLEMGYLSDTVGGCAVGSLGAGVAVRVAPPLAVRAGIMSGSHSSDGTGPVSAPVGLEYRW
jgi:hypothetical protein